MVYMLYGGCVHQLDNVDKYKMTWFDKWLPQQGTFVYDVLQNPSERVWVF